MTQQAPGPSRPRVAVVGGGVSGLAAAWALATADEPVDVVVLEGSPAVGGKLRLAEVAGQTVDVGAESVLARRPEAVDLARAVGLAGDLTTPEPVGARIWTRGGLQPLPGRTLMGVPATSEQAHGVLSAAEAAELDEGAARSAAPVEEDVDVASFVAGRVGPAVVDRLVEPLLGGVYAGHATELSLEATVPALWAAAAAGEPLRDAVERAAAAGAQTQAPVFAGVRGGVGRLPVALREALARRGVEVRTGATVRALRRTADGWRLTVGPTVAVEEVDVDAVVLATPAAPGARLLAADVPAAAAALREVEHASVAVVTLALPRTGALAHLDATGFLVPPVDGRYAKAATFSGAKWAWLDRAAPDLAFVRLSVGRHRAEADLQRDDSDVVRAVHADLADALAPRLDGHPLPAPVDALVTRWGGGLPQYAVGHVGRVARVRDAVRRVPGLAVCGATYDGVGIAACVASAQQAAQEVLTHLHERSAAGETMGA